MGEMTLQQARELAGLSQHGLDALAGVEKGTVHDLETGRNKRPSHVTVTKVVRGLRKAGLRGVHSEQIFPVEDDVMGDRSSAA